MALYLATGPSKPNDPNPETQNGRPRTTNCISMTGMLPTVPQEIPEGNANEVIIREGVAKNKNSNSHHSCLEKMIRNSHSDKQYSDKY